MSTSTRARRNRKNPTSKKNREKHLTVVADKDKRPALPVRRRLAVGPATATEMAEGHAALTAGLWRLPIPALGWRAITGQPALTRLPMRTTLVHRGGHTYAFTAWTPCPGGAHHAHTVTDSASLHAARMAAADCTTPHADAETHEALIRGVQPLAIPEPPTVRSLADAFRHDTERTQELDVTDLRADTDTEQPKEHPHG